MQDVVPQDVLNQMGKVSLGPLFERALKYWAHETVLELVENSKAASYRFVDGPKLRAYYEAYCRGEKKHPFFWYALTLETWLRHHWPSGKGFTNKDENSGADVSKSESCS